jgi:hypothetical protein
MFLGMCVPACGGDLFPCSWVANFAMGQNRVNLRWLNPTWFAPASLTGRSQGMVANPAGD